MSSPARRRRTHGRRRPRPGPLDRLRGPEFAEAAETALRHDHNKIDRLFDLLEIRVIDEDELVRAGFSLDIFRNLNTPQELEVANTNRRAQ